MKQWFDRFWHNQSLLKNFYLTVIPPIVIFWLILFSLNYPPPHIDDLFFTGAAINLAKGGDFINPWLAAWSDRVLDRFYVQPPFYSYTLAGWLSLAGISTQSLLFFQCLCYTTFSIFTALILRFYRFPRIASFCIVIAFSFWMLNMGLRQDALGMAYLAVGIWLAIQDNPLGYFLGFSLLGASVLTAPILIAYACPLGIAILISHLQKNKPISKKYLYKRVIAIGSAILFVFILFLLCIDFNLSLFLSDMSWHSSFRKQGLNKVIPSILWIVSIGYGEITNGSVYAFLLFLIALLKFNATGLQQASDTQFVKYSSKSPKILYAIAIAMAFNLLIYPSTIPGIFNFFCWVLICLTIAKVSLKPRNKATLILVGVFVFLINQSQSIIALIGKEPVPESTYRQVEQFIRENPNKPYAIDSVAARFSLNYQLPKNTIDWNFSQPASNLWPVSIEQKDPHRIWIVSPSRGSVTEGLPDYPKVKLLGREFNSIPSKPHDLTIIE